MNILIMKNNKHREPTLYIVGNVERKEEIKHIIEDEWGGDNEADYEYDSDEFVYFVDSFGVIRNEIINTSWFTKAVKNGWMKEYQLPIKPKFRPFDKVVVKVKNPRVRWWVDFYSDEDIDYYHFIGNQYRSKEYTIVLPYNKETEKLIGTTDEWSEDSCE